MKRSWIFLAILLAAISVVNASPFYVYKRDDLVNLHKRDVTFGPCAKASTITLNVKTISPDPAPGAKAVTTLSFTPAKEIAKGKFFLTTTISEGDPKAPKGIDGGVTTADLSDAGFTYPIPAGKAIALDVTTAIPAGAKAPFNIEYNFNDGDITIACAIGTAGGGGAAPPAKGAPGGDGGPPDAGKGKGKGDGDGAGGGGAAPGAPAGGDDAGKGKGKGDGAGGDGAGGGGGDGAGGGGAAPGAPAGGDDAGKGKGKGDGA